VRGETIRFTFRGKGGKDHDIDVRDRRLARIVRKIQELRGQQLFQYRADDGSRVDIGSDDVNDYLREIAGDEFTAKDFRTWAGTVAAAMALQEFGEIDDEAGRKKAVVRAVEQVAQQLGNTPSVCRACYVHPEVIDRYLDGTIVDALSRRARGAGRGAHALRAMEAAVLGLLQARLARERRSARTAA
jgi:DNA topoisomerase-1